jgi:hypothetical protein
VNPAIILSLTVLQSRESYFHLSIRKQWRLALCRHYLFGLAQFSVKIQLPFHLGGSYRLCPNRPRRWP